MRLARKPVKSKRGEEHNTPLEQPLPQTENVDSANDRQFLQKMATHTLSDVATPNTTSRDKAPSRYENSDGSEMLQTQEHSLPQHGYQEAMQSEADPAKYDDSDSEPDSFDHAFEDKRRKFREDQALENLGAQKWAEAEMFLRQILADPSHGSWHGDITNDDWRVYLSTAQVAQQKLAESLSTLKGIDSKNLIQASIGTLQFHIAIQACRDCDLKLGEKYCLKAMKSFQRLKDVDYQLFATEVLAHICLKKGDIVQNKFYESLLPSDWLFLYIDLDDCLQGYVMPKLMLKNLERSKTPLPPSPNDLASTQKNTQPKSLGHKTTVGDPWPKNILAQLEKYNLRVVDGKVHGATPDMWEAFKEVVYKDDVDFARSLLREPKNLDAQSLPDGWRPLGYAACHCMSSLIPLLLLDGGVDIESPDNIGRTALSFAAKDAKHDLCELLLKRGANVNAASRQGLTPLSYAARSGGLNTVKLLLRHNAIVDSVDQWGSTPLFKASSMGHANIVQLLLDEGAKIDHVNRGGETPLIAACHNSRSCDAVKCLLENGANCNVKNSDGMRPLDYAQTRSLPDAYKLLVSYGATQ